MQFTCYTKYRDNDGNNFVVRHYNPFLKLTSGKVDTSIRILDKYGVDWRDDDKGLWRLISNSTSTLRARLGLFELLGVSPELHYLLICNFRNGIRHFNQEGFASMREAVVSHNIPVLKNFVRGTCNKMLNRSARPPNADFFEAAENAFVTVMSECKHPEKHPAAFLTLVSHAIGDALNKEAIHFARTSSIEDFTDIPSDGTRPRRKL